MGFLGFAKLVNPIATYRTSAHERALTSRKGLGAQKEGPWAFFLRIMLPSVNIRKTHSLFSFLLNNQLDLKVQFFSLTDIALLIACPSFLRKTKKDQPFATHKRVAGYFTIDISSDQCIIES
jgi:hypothetical protein